MISARGLSRSYGEREVVSDVSFEVGPGEVFGLLGPNGAGKTTVLRMLAGILQPSRGSAEIMGFDLASDPQSAKACIGFLSGDTRLYGRLTVREMLHYFAKLYGLDEARREERVAVVIGELELADFVERKLGTLSSGQLQRANLARAFVSDPAVLLLDEPTVGLDVVSSVYLVEAVKAAKRRGKAILYSTHVMSEVEVLCDRVGILFEGVLRGSGPLPELLETFGSNSLTELMLGLSR